MTAPAQLPSIIVNADDFGLHPSINEAIEISHRTGIVTSASLMTLAPALTDAVRRAQQLPALDLGLHFTLVGLPGLPPTFPAFFQAYFQGQFSAQDIAARLRHQLDTALVTHRLSLSHIDTHQHLHAFPPIMRVVCSVASEYGIKFIRVPQDGTAHARLSHRRRLEAAVLRFLCLLSRRSLFRCNLRTTDHFSGMAVSGHLNAPTLADYFIHANAGSTEIVCHPGLSNTYLAKKYPWGYDWEGEHHALSDPNVRAAAENKRVRLIAWHEL